MAALPNIAAPRRISSSASPDAISFEQAAALPVAYGTALRMVRTIGKVSAGEKVLILGASGGVGVCAVQLAKLAGAYVIAAAGSEEKGRRLKELGADETIHYIAGGLPESEVFSERHGKPAQASAPAATGAASTWWSTITGGDTWGEVADVR
jgi:alcohol dehydrogenase